MTHDPREALEPVLSFLDELAANAAPGKRAALNPILIGGSAKLYAEGLRKALTASAPKGEPCAWGRVINGRAVTVSLTKTQANDEPLYTSPPPPPAAGWDEATNWLEGIANNDGNADQHVARRAVELLKSGQALRRESPASSGVAGRNLDAEVAALAHRFWSIHPSSLDDMGLTREQFYVQEITKLIKAVRG